MNYAKTITIFILLLSSLCLVTISAHAMCLPMPNENKTIRVAECRTLDGPNDATITTKLKGVAPHLYKGALVTDTENNKWMYPSKSATPCEEFQTNTKVTKQASYTCCDTGSWGKCIFGGRWLADIGKPAVEAFQ